MRRCGEGFSSQNCDTIVVGIGDNRSADQIAVKWPRGNQALRVGASRLLVSFHENAEHAAGGRSPVVEKYKAVETVAISPPPVVTDGIFNYPVPAVQSDESEMRVMITMATWCESCRKHLGAIGRLREETDELDISWFGVPVDGADSSIELKDYANKYAVPYQMLDDLESKYRQQTAQWIRNELGTDAQPSTILTDCEGRPLSVQAGIPTVSDIKRFHDLIGRRQSGK